MFCPNCGSPVRYGASFCYKCGNRLVLVQGNGAFNTRGTPYTKRAFPRIWAVIGVVACAVVVIATFSIGLFTGASSVPGTNGTTLSSFAYDGSMATDGEWVFYSRLKNYRLGNGWAGSAELRRMRLDGSQDEAIYEPPEGFAVSIITNPQIYRGRLYFLESDSAGLGGRAKRVVSIKFDGSDMQTVIELGEDTHKALISGSTLYYDSNDVLYGMPLDGGTAQYIIDTQWGDWSIEGEYAYAQFATSSVGSMHILRCPIGGGDIENICEVEDTYEPFAPHNGKIYYISYDKQLMCVDPKSQTVAPLALRDEGEWFDTFSVSDDGLFVVARQGGTGGNTKIYRIDENTGEKELVFVYDASWCGDIEQSRNAGGSDAAVLKEFTVLNHQILFMPSDDEKVKELREDGGPIYYSICSVGLDGSGMRELTTFQHTK